MLVLTHGSPANDTHRRVFRILHAMGLGSARQRGVVVLGDGFARFGPIAGVVCTPDGMAVLAAHQISGVEGYLFAPLRGTWTSGGQPAVIDGSIANPIQAVDVALKQIVSLVRLGGLDPGYVQSILLIDGPVSGVAQPEADRGQGAVVTRANADDLSAAIEIATARREPGLQSTWTTADVTSLLEVLGFDCSGLDTKMLTDEGFPYSPYVLRQTLSDDIPFSRPEPNPRATRSLRGYEQDRPTVVAAGPPPVPASPVTKAPPHAMPEYVYGAPQPATPGSVGMLLEPGESIEQRPSKWRWIAPIVVIALLIAGIWLGWGSLFGGSDSSADDAIGPTSSAAASSQPRSSSAAAPSSGAAPQTSGGFTFTSEMTDHRTDCAAHAYGDIKALLTQSPCTSMTRALFLTTVDGKLAVVSVADITMPNAATAAELKTTADTDGTGNVNDLLREDGVPAEMPSESVFAAGAYASAIDDTVVRIVQIGYTDGASSTPTLDAAADAALDLTL